MEYIISKEELLKKESELTLLSIELEKKYQYVIGQKEMIKEILKNFVKEKQ